MQRLINIIKSVEKIEKLLGIQHKDDGDNYTYYTRYSLIVKSLCYYEIPYFYNILLNFKLSNFNVYGSINTVITHMGLPIAGPGLDFNLWLGALGGYYHWTAIPMIITSFLHWLPVLLGQVYMGKIDVKLSQSNPSIHQTFSLFSCSELSGQLIERVATEFNKLQFYVNKSRNMSLVTEIKPVSGLFVGYLHPSLV